MSLPSIKYKAKAANRNSSLQKRILTASILIPVVVLIILYAPIKVFAVLTAVVIALAAWEWTQMAGLKTVWGRVLALLALPIVLLTIFAILQSISHFFLNDGQFFDEVSRVISWIIVLFWVMASIAVTRYPKGKVLYHSRLLNLFIGMMVILPAYFAILALQIKSPYLLIYIIALVCVADSAAYFIGKKWGKTHFCPELSPGKTLEGVGAALIAGLLVAGLGFFILKVKMSVLIWFLLNVITVLFSIVGDLFESLFKREQNLKDSGNLLPGHGGVMDRLDSLTAAIPIFAIGLML